jgi:hypothetical protein
MMAAVHLSAAVSVPAAVAAAVLMMWYWKRIGADDVPESRRRIRRASLAVMLVILPVLVHAVSFADADRAPGTYVAMWTLVLFAIVLILLTVGLDVLNTLRLSRRERRHSLIEAAAAAARGPLGDDKKEEGPHA